jgi:Tfp pilus assembly protein PilF
VIYLSVRLIVAGFGARTIYLASSLYHTMLTMTKVFAIYALLMVAPVNLSIERIIPPGIPAHGISWVYDRIILGQSPIDLDVLLSVAVILTMVIVGFQERIKLPILAFGLGWFMISLTPVSNIMPLAVVMSERYLYIPSFGFCLIIAWWLTTWAGHLEKKGMHQARPILLSLFTLALLLLAGLTYNRNADWKNNLVLWEKTMLQSPQSHWPHLNLGVEYMRQGLLQKAQIEFKKALEINPDLYPAYNNLGQTYLLEGRDGLALLALNRSIQIAPAVAQPHIGMALVFLKNGEYANAVHHLEAARKISPQDPGTCGLLAEAYSMMGDGEGAIRQKMQAAQCGG